MLFLHIQVAEGGLIHSSEMTKLGLGELKTDNKEKVSNLTISFLSSPTSTSAAPTIPTQNEDNMTTTSEC